MDELLRRYEKEVLDNPQEFLSRESKKFPSNYTEEDKVKSEYIGLQSYYFDKNSNESFFDPNQDYVIQQTLSEIKELIDQEDYDTASYFIVSLQILLDLDVRMNRVVYNMIQNSISISDFVDTGKYLGNEDTMVVVGILDSFSRKGVK